MMHTTRASNFLSLQCGDRTLFVRPPPGLHDHHTVQPIETQLWRAQQVEQPHMPHQKQHMLERWRLSSSRSEMIGMLQQLMNKPWVSGQRLMTQQMGLAHAQHPRALRFKNESRDDTLTSDLVSTHDSGTQDLCPLFDEDDTDMLVQDEGGQGPATTMVVRNIPEHYKTEDLVELWPADGTWDFLYLPLRTGGKCNIGFAFINLTSEGHASAFASSWQGKCLPTPGTGRRLKVISAAIQGLEANVAELKKKTAGRMRARKCDPIVIKDGRRVPFSEL